MSVVPIDAGVAVTRALAAAERASEALRGLEDTRLVRAIAAAMRALASDAGPRAEWAERSGLSPEGVTWALTSTLGAIDERALVHALATLDRAAPHRVPRGAVAMILAGNVFTACVRPIVWALLSRSPVIARESARHEGLTEPLAAALAAADPALAEAVSVVRFAREETRLTERLLGSVDVAHVYGSDQTVWELRVMAPATTDVIAHGHGLGVALVPAALLDADALAHAIALDVAAYDQRGCLSPHAVLVERGGAIDPEALAARLADALAELARTLPRGPLDVEAGAQQVQWRGVSAAMHTLHEGDGHAVSYEADAPLRPCVGHRNIAVHAVANLDDALARLRPLGVHLKALGVAGTEATRADLARRLPAPLAPRISDLGDMQRPELTAPADGDVPWRGMIRVLR